MTRRFILAHLQRNFTLAYPVMLSQLGHVMVGVADSAMVGRLGPEPLAAAALGNVIFYLLFTFGMGVSYAITPLVAAADGEGDKQQIGRVLNNGFLINLITGVIIFSVVVLGSGVLYHLDQDEGVVRMAVPYLKIITLSIIPFMIFQTFRQFAEGLSLTRQAMYITISANVINVGLNYLFIFGKGGFEPMGLDGAGWATLISRVLMAAGMVGFILFWRRFKPYWREFGIKKYSKALISRLLGIGIPAGLQFTFEVGAFGVTAIMIGWFGAEALAAHQIAINLASITYMVATGLAASATIRVGNQLGRKDIPQLRMAAFTIFGMVIILMTFSAVIFIALRNYLPYFYISDVEVVAIAAPLLVIAGLFQLSDGLQVVALGALRGMEDVKIPTVFTFVAYWVLGIPLGYYLGFVRGLGPEGVWYGLLVGLSVVAITLCIRFQRFTKRLLALHSN